jgi:putative molybdopterin biosynthesis protein
MRSRLREWRERRGLTQQELARRAGVSRQTVGGIEAGRYGPGVEVGLRLARALACRVEDLFDLEEAEVPAAVPDGTRVAVAEIAGRTAVRSLLGLGGVRWHAAMGHGVARGGRVRRWAGSRPALFLAGCDPALGLLAAHCPVPGYWWQAGNAEALAQLARGEVHAAAVHGAPGRGPAGYLRVRLARWQMGWVVARGNPAGFRDAGDLPRLTLASREPGSGARTLLDELAAAPARARVFDSHAAVAEAVALGLADVGVAPAVAATEYGLDFLPIRDEVCDLLVVRDDPAAAWLVDTLRSGRFTADLAAFGPYDVSRTGDEVA